MADDIFPTPLSSTELNRPPYSPSLAMVVKREYSESGSDFADEDEDIKPVITPTKKSRSTPSKTKTQSPSSSSKSAKSQSDSGSSSKKTKLDNSAKRTIAEEIINVGIKGINVVSLAKAVRPSPFSFSLLYALLFM